MGRRAEQFEEWGSCDKNKSRIFSVPTKQATAGDIDDEVKSWSIKSPSNSSGTNHR